MERSINYEKIILILVAICLVFIDGVGGKRALTSLETRTQIEHLNKLPVKSIKSEDGDVIDCVDIYKQPAFDHPLLKNHTIQMRPSNYNSEKKSSNQFKQASYKSIGSCPEGTIPIFRTPKTNLFRMAPTLEGQRDNSHEPAIESAKLYVNHVNIGGEAFINVWNVHVEKPAEFSTASIFVGVKGKRDMINSGTIVSQGVCGDNKTRLYVFWESDNGGCYNLRCPGFVHINKNIYPCAEIYPLSVYGGQQFAIHVKMYKDLESGHWWVQYGDEPVGYWPVSLFGDMAKNADIIQYGGQVWNSAPGGVHTSTQMGSGHFSNEGGKKSAFIKNCLFYDLDGYRYTPLNSPTRATKPFCYDISGVGRDKPGPGANFLYGGPGGAGCDEVTN